LPFRPFFARQSPVSGYRSPAVDFDGRLFFSAKPQWVQDVVLRAPLIFSPERPKQLETIGAPFAPLAAGPFFPLHISFCIAVSLFFALPLSLLYRGG
jgi:hypothetical protein